MTLSSLIPADKYYYSVGKDRWTNTSYYLDTTFEKGSPKVWIEQMKIPGQEDEGPVLKAWIMLSLKHRAVHDPNPAPLTGGAPLDPVQGNGAAKHAG